MRTIERFSLILITATLGLWAQNPYGRVIGRVMDSSGAVVPGCRVSLINTATGVPIATESDAQGNYEARNLIPGQYRLVAESPGFRRLERGPFEVRLGDVLTVDVSLELGAMTETITITTEAPLLDAATASLGQVIDSRRLSDLPTPHANTLYLTQLVPGVIHSRAPTQNWQPNQIRRMTELSASGGSITSNQVILDGVPNMRKWYINIPPPPEVIQEVRVDTAAFDAASGRYTGAQVTMTTKAGTNEFHGTATYTHNNRPLNARPFFVNKRIYDLSTGPVTPQKITEAWPPTRLNRYRATASGPVLIPMLYNGKNRTFWTYAADRFSRALVSRVTSLTVPTVPQRNGDFSALLALGAQYQIYDPATIAPAAGGRFSRQPLAGNIIPASRIDPLAKRLMSYYPMPTTAGAADGSNNYIGTPVNRPQNLIQIVRVDHVVSPSQRFFVSFQPDTEKTPNQNSSGFQDDFLGQTDRAKGFNLTLDDVITARPDLVLNFRYGIARLNTLITVGSEGFDLTSAGFPATLVNQIPRKLATLPRLNVTNYTAIGHDSGYYRATNYHFVTASAAHNRANHSLRAGAEFRAYQENAWYYGNFTPAFEFGTLWTRGPLDNSPAAPIGQGLASFLFGLPTGGYADRADSYAAQSKFLAVFGQDDWKLARRLTLNLGLRYEVELPTTERYNRINRGYDFSTPNPIQAAAAANYALSPIPEVPAAQFRTVGGLLFANTGGTPRGLWTTDKNNFSPRVGLAWQVRPTVVVRAGYGVFFESFGIDRVDITQQGFSQRTTLVPSDDNGLTFRARLSNPFPDGIRPPAGASLGLRTFLGQSISFFTPERRPGYLQRWTFNVQRQFPHRVMAEAGYVGSRGTGLTVDESVNAVPAQYLSRLPVRDQETINRLTQVVTNPFFGLPEFQGTGLQGRTVARSQLLRPLPHFSGVSTASSSGFSWYHALQARAEKRFSHGYTLQASYTWSKAMEAVAKLNDTDLHPHHVISSLDRPHRIVLSGIYELPFGKGKRWLAGARGWAQQAAGGWSLQGMYHGQSGPPIGFGNVLFRGRIQDLVLPRSERKVERWFNIDAGFERAAAQQLAQNIRTFPLRLTGLRADGHNSFDLSLFKNFRIKERFSLEFRLEAQDALNHALFAAPNTTPTSASFGQVTATDGTQREVFVGARLRW